MSRVKALAGFYRNLANDEWGRSAEEAGETLRFVYRANGGHADKTDLRCSCASVSFAEFKTSLKSGLGALNQQSFHLECYGTELHLSGGQVV